MNASGRFASTLSKRNRHQLSHSALAHIHPATKRLTTLQFAGAEDLKTVSGWFWLNIDPAAGAVTRRKRAEK
jgi:hypothetical protein